MKFKVGDRVKNKNTGELFKIIKVDKEDTFLPYRAKNKKGDEYWFEEEKLTEVEYTYEDLKKSPIGTKVTFENGEVLVKNGEDKFESRKSFTYIDCLKDLTSYTFGKIIKIEEPEYTTVYEAKQEILDETEKRYLRNIVRPFRDKIDYIIKNRYKTENLEYIIIAIKEDQDLEFPYFKEGTMYKGMKLNKGYSLEELGI